MSSNANAEVTISASVDKKTVELNDNVVLTITVSVEGGANISEPQIPRMSNFNVYSSGRSQNISIINGKFSSSVVFTYVLTPRFIGKAQIPSISLFHGKQKLMTPPIDITVIKPQSSQNQTPVSRTAQPQVKYDKRQPSELIFVTAEVDKKTAYVQQQITLTVRFYTAIPLLGNPQYIPPDFKELISEDLPPVRTGETTINGIKYFFNEIKTALFAVHEGESTIGPAKVQAEIRTEEEIDPFAPDFFQKFFSHRIIGRQTRDLKSDPINLKILPLPETSKPSSFKGAVGNYIISASIDRQELKMGEALNLSLKISGKGNLKTVTAPELPEMPNFKVYDTMSSLNITKHADIIGGQKVFTTVLIPKSVGKHTIPPVKFSFFNPETKSYEEIQTNPLEINVLKSDNQTQQFVFSKAETPPSEITPVSEDIAYIKKTISKPLSTSISLKIASIKYLNLFPVLFFLGSLTYVYINNLKVKNPLRFKYMKAYGKAKSNIKKAKKVFDKNDNSRAVSILYLTLTNYLSDKTGQNVMGMTLKKTAELLKQKFPNVSEYSIETLKDLWNEIEILKFTPSKIKIESGNKIIEKFNLLLDILEKEMNKK